MEELYGIELRDGPDIIGASIVVARCLVSDMVRGTLDKSILVEMVLDQKVHWRLREAILDALCDGRVQMWPEMKEACIELLREPQKLLVLGALLNLLRHECSEDNLLLYQSKMNQVHRDKNLGRKLYDMIKEW